MINILASKKESSLTGEEEIILIDRSIKGDASAFKQLYNCNVSRVYAVCLRISTSKQKAEELTQDVFVKAWENLSSFRRESRFSTWLFRIAVNTALIDLRSRRRWLSRFKYIGDVFKFDKKISLTGGNNIDLERAISYLPEKARIVFVLHDIEGYKHEEIAEMLSNTSGTTKAQLHRARKLLKEALNK
jgi:RNA polymerase sigma-70 factor (ECF subfamily)